MAEKKTFSVDFPDFVTVDHAKADFLREIVEQPYVVVADEPCDLTPLSANAESAPKKRMYPRGTTVRYSYQ